MADQVARIAVVVASSGRADHLICLLQQLRAQTCRPTVVVFSVADPSDAPPPDTIPTDFPVLVLVGPRGLTRQRNHGLDAVRDMADFVAFFDDDYVPSLRALDGVVRAFAAFPEAGGITGQLLADGIRNGGLSMEDALARVRRHDAEQAPYTPRILEKIEGLYGCNMVFRMDRLAGLRFDERLPLYGWQEDIDFSTQVRGDKIRTNAFAGVHCGTKQGRERQGMRLGYSQIVNPVYLMRKGTMSRRLGLRHMLRNLVANHVKLVSPEPWIDRKGRASGNRRAVLDVLRGRVEPERILEI